MRTPWPTPYAATSGDPTQRAEQHQLDDLARALGDVGVAQLAALQPRGQGLHGHRAVVAGGDPVRDDALGDLSALLGPLDDAVDRVDLHVRDRLGEPAEPF